MGLEERGRWGQESLFPKSPRRVRLWPVTLLDVTPGVTIMRGEDAADLDDPS